MFKKFSITFVILSLSMGASFIATILLGRTLTPDNFGIYNLLRKIVLVAPSIGILGLNYSFTKIYANQKSISKYLLYTVLIIGIITSTIIALILSVIYHFNTSHSFYILLIILFGIITNFSSQYYRLKDKYLIGQFVLSGWKIIFLLFLILIICLFDIMINQDLIFRTIALASFLPATLIFIYISPLKNNNALEFKKIKSLLIFGALFWLVNSFRMISGQIENFIIPVLASHKIFGIYSAIGFFFITSLKIGATALGYVIFPTISKGEKIKWRAVAFYMFVIIAVVLVIYPLLGKDIVNILYKGKYNEYSSFSYFLMFTLIGISKSIFSIFHFYIVAKSNKIDLLLYLFFSVLSIIIYIISLIIINQFFVINLLSIIGAVLFVRIVDMFLLAILLRRVRYRKIIAA